MSPSEVNLTSVGLALYRVENTPVSLEKKQNRGTRDFNKMTKKEAADTSASSVPNHSVFNLCKRHLEIYK